MSENESHFIEVFKYLVLQLAVFSAMSAIDEVLVAFTIVEVKLKFPSSNTVG